MKILGIKIDQIDTKESLRLIEEFVKSKKPHQVVTTNPEMIITALRDKEYKDVLNGADLNLPDGIGVVWASKILGKPLKERVAGTDLIFKLAELAAQKGYSIYFLGAGPGISEKAARKLKEIYPSLEIAGTETGSPYDLILIEKINEKRPDILLVAFGHPKQEKWIFKYKDRLGAPVAIGVGGAFDFISGKIRRAPLWIRKLGFEWFYRLIKEPWRIKRQVSLFTFSWLVLKQYLNTRVRK